MKKQFEDYLEAVAAQTLQNGGTASKPNTCDFLPIRDVWSFPKYPSKTAILPPSVNLLDELRAFIAKNEIFLNETDCWLGTWIHPQTGEYYLDVATGIEELNKAREIAIQAGRSEGREIVAMFNPKRNQTFFLKQRSTYIDLQNISDDPPQSIRRSQQDDVNNITQRKQQSD